jgi:hypothetical protein
MTQIYDKALDEMVDHDHDNSLALITSGTVISNIQNPVNWATGNYTGSTTGLVSGNYYIDISNGFKYEFLSGVLFRTVINSMI